MVSFLGVPNFEYIGGGIGILIFIALIWWILGKTRQGRIGEEQQEERETDRLKNDEVVVEATQRDEKKQCKKLNNLFSDIMIILREGNNTLAEKLYDTRLRISVILAREVNEKMSVRTALQTFNELHALINEFLAELPNNNQINVLVEKIKKRQQRYYQDLIKELEMDDDKKKTLQKLWTQVLDEERGQGKLQAA